MVEAVDFTNRYLAVRGPKGNAVALKVAEDVQLEGLQRRATASRHLRPGARLEMIPQPSAKRKPSDAGGAKRRADCGTRCGTPAAAQSHWTFSLAPYIWLPNINGTLRYQPPPSSATRPEVETGPNDYLENLDFALMIAAEARKGTGPSSPDIIYLDFSDESAQVKSLSGPGGWSGNARHRQRDLAEGAGVAGGGEPGPEPRSADHFEVLGGVRYVRLETALDWRLAGAAGGFAQSGNLSQKKDLTDAIVGLRGQAWLGDGQWLVPYYLDVGGG